MTTSTAYSEGASELKQAAVNSAPISSIRMMQTGQGMQHKEHRFGSWMPRLVWVMISQSWVPVPINAFLIEHRDGLVLFDTGIDPAIALDDGYIDSAVGRFLLHRIFRWDIKQEDALKYKLQELKVNPDHIQKAVISHLHFDHVGGIADIPKAELLVSEAEWAELSKPHPEHEWMLREHIQLPTANWQPVSFAPTDDPLLKPFGGAFDVMGDGSMMMLPTPGHTPGSSSLLLRSDNLRPVLLIGDLSYQADLLMANQVPGTGDAKLLRESYAKVRELKYELPELVIIASHDVRAGELLSNAMEAS